MRANTAIAWTESTWNPLAGAECDLMAASGKLNRMD